MKCEMKIVDKKVVKTVKEKYIVLTLMTDEAKALTAVCGQIGGKCDSRIRKVTDPLYHEIQKALGLNYQDFLAIDWDIRSGINIGANG